MSRIPANRLFVFVLLASVALTVDLYTKAIVFNDLGYPGAERTPPPLVSTIALPLQRVGKAKASLTSMAG